MPKAQKGNHLTYSWVQVHDLRSIPDLRGIESSEVAQLPPPGSQTPTLLLRLAYLKEPGHSGSYKPLISPLSRVGQVVVGL